MSLVVEDGTGLANADSYISEADANTWHTNRGNTAWAALASATIREQCLRKATDYMLQAYRNLWKGSRISSVQALDWPRYSVYTENLEASLRYAGTQFLVSHTIVPLDVAHACAELALKASSAALNPDLSQQILSQTVGPISTTYSENSPQHKRYRAIDLMLRPYLLGGSASLKVIRT